MDLADSFTWEDLPTRDADTGHLTAAGWIPLIKTYTVRAAVTIMVTHTVQTSTRIVTDHEMMYAAWYPFDWTVSPFYELVLISQVKITVYKNDIILIKVIILSWMKASRFIRHLRYPLSFFLSYDTCSLKDCNTGWMIMMKWKAFGRMCYWSNWGTVSRVYFKKLRKIRKQEHPVYLLHSPEYNRTELT